ncbi:uncharacterized protein LOC135707814 [Ochlerotatus camptorhynchus]|uniref:uncharacterized protein LOC135707814 n=1 Tax=Ochlerotatus camptorhynchus TaxID=644619 RepID=UPI0031DB4818
MDTEKVEYELQHFNFCSDDIISENRQLVKFVIQSTFLSFSKEFIKKHKVPEKDAKAMLANCYTTSLQMFVECGPKLDEISQLYKSTFTIPDSILLPSDLMHRKDYSAEQVELLQTKVKELEQQIRQDGVFLSMLEEEIKLHDRLASCIEDEVNLMNLVDHHRQLEIVPAEDCAVVQDLADVMKDVMRMK